MNSRAMVGRRGEDEACAYLMTKGQSIVERNWRSGHLEVDIITMDSQGIHFVEVKSRVAPIEADPQDNVNTLKQRRIASAAQRYLSLKHMLEDETLEVWFDVVAVVFDGSDTRIEYFPAAYVPIHI